MLFGILLLCFTLVIGCQPNIDGRIDTIRIRSQLTTETILHGLEFEVVSVEPGESNTSLLFSIKITNVSEQSIEFLDDSSTWIRNVCYSEDLAPEQLASIENGTLISDPNIGCIGSMVHTCSISGDDRMCYESKKRLRLSPREEVHRRVEFDSLDIPSSTYDVKIDFELQGLLDREACTRIVPLQGETTFKLDLNRLDSERVQRIEQLNQ